MICLQKWSQIIFLMLPKGRSETNNIYVQSTSIYADVNWKGRCSIISEMAVLRSPELHFSPYVSASEKKGKRYDMKKEEEEEEEEERKEDAGRWRRKRNKRGKNKKSKETGEKERKEKRLKMLDKDGKQRRLIYRYHCSFCNGMVLSRWPVVTEGWCLFFKCRYRE